MSRPYTPLAIPQGSTHGGTSVGHPPGTLDLLVLESGALAKVGLSTVALAKVGLSTVALAKVES
jgi:hypothetical protein